MAQRRDRRDAARGAGRGRARRMVDRRDERRRPETETGKMTILKVMAVDDEELALRRVALLLADIEGAELIATIQDPLDALTQIDRLRPDVLLLDIQKIGRASCRERGSQYV